MKNLSLLFSALIFPALLSCSTDPNKPVCDGSILPDRDLYLNGPADALSISSVELSGDCLTIEFMASGCDGTKWSVKLLDSEVIIKTYPPQKDIRLSLDNPEPCRALITKKMSFDLTPARIADIDIVHLNLQGWDTRISYIYETDN